MTTPPLFYKNPRPIDIEKHKHVKLLPINSFDFTLETNSVPLAVTEFTVAANHFPIVFSETEKPIPIALLGLDSNRNAFVQEGRWQAGYVPAYIRRYPFTFAADPEAKTFTLCIDEGANLFSETEAGKPLFTEEGTPSDFLRDALVFCTQYQKDWQSTHQFVDALKEAGMLIPKIANFSHMGAERARFGGFLTIDEEKFKALDDATFLQWRQKGWISLVYAHWFSQSHWQHLFSLTQAAANAPSSGSAVLEPPGV